MKNDGKSCISEIFFNTKIITIISAGILPSSQLGCPTVNKSMDAPHHLRNQAPLRYFILSLSEIPPPSALDLIRLEGRNILGRLHLIAGSWCHAPRHVSELEVTLRLFFGGKLGGESALAEGVVRHLFLQLQLFPFFFPQPDLVPSDDVSRDGVSLVMAVLGRERVGFIVLPLGFLLHLLQFLFGLLVPAQEIFNDALSLVQMGIVLFLFLFAFADPFEDLDLHGILLEVNGLHLLVGLFRIFSGEA